MARHCRPSVSDYAGCIAGRIPVQGTGRLSAPSSRTVKRLSIDSLRLTIVRSATLPGL